MIRSPKCPHPIIKRVQGEFNQYRTLSGRFTNSKPNLQQQPSRYPEWRQFYTAALGNKIIACDYSQIELRIIDQLAEIESIYRHLKQIWIYIKRQLHKCLMFL